jgi:hypothetical protein
MSLITEIRVLSNRPVIRCLALAILFTASTRFEPLSSAVLDPDLWWHLRGGDTIVAQHTVPHHGVFTQHAERPWVEYSWGFEVIASRFYHWFGLMGLVSLRLSLEAVITAILFVILRRGLHSFWQALPLTGLGMWAIHHCLGMQPMLTSIVLFTFELALIFEARRRGTVRPLFLLPLIFLFWANLHIQFVYGLVVLALLAVARVIRNSLPSRWSSEIQPQQDLPLAPLLGVTVLSILATLVGPYSWHLYAVLFDYIRSSVPYSVISELQALSFRAPAHFILVLIIAAGFFALGWRRSRDPFTVSLLVICTLVGLRMTRDSWLACLPALAIIADRGPISLTGCSEERRGRTRLRAFSFAAATAGATALMFLLVAWDSKTNNISLSRTVANYFPTAACAYVRDHSLPGPIYNDMNWGGFLIWALPEQPVAIDNRTDLYGDELLSRSYLVQQGFADWKADPELNAARVVLLNRRVPLASLLIHDPRFHLVYSDPQAIVLTRDDAFVSVSRPVLP